MAFHKKIRQHRQKKTSSVDGCGILPETQFVQTCLCVDTTQVLSVGGSIPQWVATGERPEFDIKPPLVTSLLIFPRSYLLKSFPQEETFSRQQGFKIRVFPLLGEMPKAIKPHLTAIQLATRSHHVVFAYDQVVRPHSSYRPLGGLAT